MPNDLLTGTAGRVGPESSSGTWRTERLNLTAYLRRIGYFGPLTPDERTLTALHRAHIATIPFENLDIILGRGISVDLDQVQAKLVDRGRGGYCYEHAVLFGAALSRLGFRVDRLLARTGDPAEHPRPRSHMVLRVGIGDQWWLADVGFGSGLLAPLPLAAAGPQRQGAWEYELVLGRDSAWRLREHDGERWTTIQTFTEEPQYLVDVEIANDNTASHPKSPFVQRPIVVRKDDTSVRSLLGRELSVEQPGQPMRQRMLTDDELADWLRREFGTALAPAEVDQLIATLAPRTDDPPAPVAPTAPIAPPAPIASPAPIDTGRPTWNEQLRLAVITASVRKDRMGPTVTRWLLAELDQRTDAQIDVIDLKGLDLPDDLAGGGDAGAFAKRIDRADAVVVVTPEYNHGYPGALKTAIDTALAEWRAKPVGFVSYGGVSGGLRAVEQLRTVFAELHTITPQAVVSLPYAWEQFDEHGTLRRPERAEAAAATLLRQLSWWARALRHGRSLVPYDG